MRSDQWPGWFYGPNGEAQVFQNADEVPEGWFDSPQKATEHAAKTKVVEEVRKPGRPKRIA